MPDVSSENVTVVLIQSVGQQAVLLD